MVSDDPPVFDLRTALAFMPEQGVRRVALGFQRTADDIRGDLSVAVARLKTRHSEDSWDELRRLAHSLKSSAAYLGGEALRISAASVEEHAANQQQAAIVDEVTDLDEQLEKFCEALRGWLSQQPGAHS